MGRTLFYVNGSFDNHLLPIFFCQSYKTQGLIPKPAVIFWDFWYILSWVWEKFVNVFWTKHSHSMRMYFPDRSFAGNNYLSVWKSPQPHHLSAFPRRNVFLSSPSICFPFLSNFVFLCLAAEKSEVHRGKWGMENTPGTDTVRSKWDAERNGLRIGGIWIG